MHLYREEFEIWEERYGPAFAQWLADNLQKYQEREPVK